MMTPAIQDVLLDVATTPNVSAFRAKIMLADAGVPGASRRIASSPDGLVFRLECGRWVALEEAI